jgi:hypothetical protein
MIIDTTKLKRNFEHLGWGRVRGMILVDRLWYTLVRLYKLLLNLLYQPDRRQCIIFTKQSELFS